MCTQTGCRNPLHCIVPPFILENMAKSDNTKVRDFAIKNLAQSAAARATREILAFAPNLLISASPAASRYRLVYDMRGNTSPLPGILKRSEGDPASGDTAVDEAYRYSGNVYDFYKGKYGRNSLDGNGMTLVSSVHYGHSYNNAFWNGSQMSYGDGDGIVFSRFTKSLDVVGHELTHGVVQFTCNLEYSRQPGALNEHFADVFGVLVKQWRMKKPLSRTMIAKMWLIGNDLIVTAPTRKAIRSMSNPGTAYTNDPYLGTDPQPKHMSHYYAGSADSYGVHINSGIPNHAFYLAAKGISGAAWDKPGKIWYKTMLALTRTSDFDDCARASIAMAGSLYGVGGAAQKAVKKAWKTVGVI
jgi:Zn-dependent metalloprotease